MIPYIIEEHPLTLHTALTVLHATVSERRQGVLTQTRIVNGIAARLIVECGICENVLRMIGKVKNESVHLKELVVHWPKFSGVSAFPVPANRNNGHSGAYIRHHAKDNQWGINPNQRDEYTELRMELLEFLVNETKPK
jgi:hypothetical protein